MVVTKASMDHTYVTGAADGGSTQTDMDGTLRCTSCSGSRQVARSANLSKQLARRGVTLALQFEPYFSIGLRVDVFICVSKDQVRRWKEACTKCTTTIHRITHKGKILPHDLLTMLYSIERSSVFG